VISHVWHENFSTVIAVSDEAAALRQQRVVQCRLTRALNRVKSTNPPKKPSRACTLPARACARERQPPVQLTSPPSQVRIQATVRFIRLIRTQMRHFS
jgi:hypothetical protein